MSVSICKPNFALIGAAGYIAPKHMEAIKSIGGNLIAAVDPHDSVGILDSYFPKCSFFTEFERFDRFCEKLRRNGERIDYVSICSPNYLHDAHCRFALRIDANAICEKPLVLKNKNLDALEDIERERNKRVYSILQLRLHPNAIRLKSLVDKRKGTSIVRVEYVAPRGLWYNYSWKGSIEKSGGLATNIGIHLFDLLLWLFGPVRLVDIRETVGQGVKGTLGFYKTAVSINLSIDGDTSSRVFSVNGEDYDFTKNFTGLHTKSYENIINGYGFGIEDVRPAIKLCEEIRNG